MPEGCIATELDGGTLSGAWSFENGGDQTQFGGDAEFMVTVSDGAEPPMTYDLEIEIDVVKYDADAPEGTFDGLFAYSCLVDEVDTEMLAFGSCTGMVTDLDATIQAAVDAQLEAMELLPEDFSYDGYSLSGISIKAMNPGMKKRQNYPKVDICDVPDPEPEV
ncbi:hypothetical protein [Vibrio quintilis]|uniref:Uncharacterized protein n=1 Tax=Vibrio quintilis TaxID=1117707 RepID=A0A1M7YRI2_9VIBR|nr:hypothetical protein [Vibrio quintilis]SHO55220.1 hypothetical protein VQ7734_00939 [Vibrio quintilis]